MLLNEIPAEQGIRLTESMVDPHVEAVVVLGLRRSAGVVVDGCVRLRERHQIEDRGGGRIDPVSRNHVARKPQPGEADRR